MQIGDIISLVIFLSLALNLVLLLRVQQLQKSLRKLKGGVELSKEELQRLRERITKIKGLS